MQPEVIIVGAGGIKGYLELGSLLYLETKGYLSNVNKYYGVSIGSLICLLLISNYTIPEILDNLLFIDKEEKKINFSMLMYNFGVMDIESIKGNINKLIIKKWGKILTLKELYLATGIEYNSVVTNNDIGSHEFMNYNTYPDISCVEACICSMTIPIIFPKAEYKGVLYTDGAITCSFPSIHIDDGETNILAIHIITNNTYKGNLLYYIYNNINMCTNNTKEIAITKASDKCKLILLYSDITDILGNSTTIQDRANMYIEGYNITKLEMEK